MKFETFKAGRWQARYQYKSFDPVPVNHEWTWENASKSKAILQAKKIDRILLVTDAMHMPRSEATRGSPAPARNFCIDSAPASDPP